MEEAGSDVRPAPTASPTCPGTLSSLARSTVITRTTTRGRGFLFLPRFLEAVSRNGEFVNGRSETYRHDASLHAAEIAAVLLLAVLDYFLLCPRGAARKPGQGF